MQRQRSRANNKLMMMRNDEDEWSSHINQGKEITNESLLQMSPEIQYDRRENNGMGATRDMEPLLNQQQYVSDGNVRLKTRKNSSSTYANNTESTGFLIRTMRVLSVCAITVAAIMYLFQSQEKRTLVADLEGKQMSFNTNNGTLATADSFIQASEGTGITQKGTNQKDNMPVSPNTKVMTTHPEQQQDSEGNILMDWIEQRQKVQEEYLNEIQKMTLQLQDSYYALPPTYNYAHENNNKHTDTTTVKSDDAVFPSYRELEEIMIPILQQGILFAGDSTSRILLGFVHCLMMGYYRNHEEDKKGDVKCSQFQQKLKTTCSGSDKEACVNNNMTFPEYTSLQNKLLLEWKSHYHLADPVQWISNINSINNTATAGKGQQGPKTKILYMGIPCLHSLWSPGAREQAVHGGGVSTWPKDFSRLFSALLGKETIPQADNAVVLLGLPTCICDSKLGRGEKGLIDAYLQRKTFGSMENVTSEKLIQVWNRNIPQKHRLDENFTGEIPALRPYRANHSKEEDQSMFDNAGQLYCTKRALESLLQEMKQPMGQSTTPHRKVIVLDMYKATSDSCHETPDGRHYNGMALMRQAMTIVEGIKQHVGAFTKLI